MSGLLIVSYTHLDVYKRQVVNVLIYWLIFGPIGFKSAPPVPNASYVQWLVPGIAPWFFFAEALNCGTGCLQEYNYLVKKVVFRVEILPIIKLISCLFVHGLDVYKRQVCDRPGAGKKGDLCGRLQPL